MSGSGSDDPTMLHKNYAGPSPRVRSRSGSGALGFGIYQERDGAVIKKSRGFDAVFVREDIKLALRLLRERTGGSSVDCDMLKDDLPLGLCSGRSRRTAAEQNQGCERVIFHKPNVKDEPRRERARAVHEA